MTSENKDDLLKFDNLNISYLILFKSEYLSMQNYTLSLLRMSSVQFDDGSKYKRLETLSFDTRRRDSILY